MASRDERLHKLHDGELSAAEAEALRTELTAEDNQKLEALAELDQLLGDTLSAEADAQKVDLWAGIAAKLPEVAAAEEAPVIPLRRRVAFRMTAVTSALAFADPAAYRSYQYALSEADKGASSGPAPIPPPRSTSWRWRSFTCCSGGPAPSLGEPSGL